MNLITLLTTNILENVVRQIQIKFSKFSTYEEQTMQSSRAFDVHL